MADEFDPDEYLASKQTAVAEPTPFDPDAYLKAKGKVEADRINFSVGTPSPENILANAAQAAVETVKDFVPTSVGAVAKMVTPIASVPEDIQKTYGTVKDVIAGKPVEEALRANAPELFTIADAEKTAPYSKERFKAGFGTLAQIGTAAAIGKGLTPKTTAVTEVKPNAIQNIEATQPDGLRTRPEVPQKVEEPASSVSSQGVPESGQGQEVQRSEPSQAVELPKLTNTEEAVAHGKSGTANPDALQAEHDRLIEQSKSETGDKKVETITQAQLYREAAETARQSQPQSLTSIKNEQVDLERKARGLPEVTPIAKKSFGKVWDEVSAKIDENPSYPDELIAELQSKPRALKDVEDAALLHRQVDLQNQFSKASEALIKAQESGDELGVTEGNARVNALSDQLLELYNVGKKAGTETGRGLNARKMLAAEDFSLGNMIRQKRVANQGKPLTAEQTAEVNRAHKKITAAKLAYDAYETSPKAEAYRKRLRTLTEDYKRRTKEGDFSPRARKPIPLDKDLEQRKSNLERAKREFQKALSKDRAANRTTSQKFWDRFVGVERAMKLSSDVVLAKLTLAAAAREMVLTPAEEVAGGAISKALPKLAARAPREGGFSPQAEIQAKVQMFTKGMEDSWQNLKMKPSDLEVMYGKGRELTKPDEFYDYLGFLHGALKAPVKRAEFARSLTKRMEWALKDGRDINRMDVMRELSDEAYVDANRSIFMQDNVVSNLFSNAMRSAETSKIAPNLGPAIARIGRFLVPIVKVPTNIVGEVATGVHGILSGGTRAAVAYIKGIDKLEPAHADAIMRQLKKGLIGNALILTGWYGYKSIGGFYHDNDRRDKEDVKPGRYRIGGVDIPASAGHSTGAMLMNIGATMHRVQDEQIKKSSPDTKGTGEALRATTAGLAHEIPFVPAVTGIAEALDTQHGFQKYINSLITSTTTPAITSHIAKVIDTPGSFPQNALDEATPRKPQNVLQAVEMGIPGLRQKVPEREEKKTSTKGSGIPKYRAFKPRKH